MNLEMMADETAQTVELAKDESFVQHARRGLTSRLRQAGLRPGDAEDLTQECLVELITHFERFDPAKGTIDQWISGFARNAARSWFRRDAVRRCKEISYLQAPESGLASTGSQGEADGIRCGLQTLCPIDQELL